MKTQFSMSFQVKIGIDYVEMFPFAFPQLSKIVRKMSICENPKGSQNGVLAPVPSHRRCDLVYLVSRKSAVRLARTDSGNNGNLVKLKHLNKILSGITGV